MYCYKCGTKAVDETARFCSNCGGELLIEQHNKPSAEGIIDDHIINDSSGKTVEENNLDNNTQEERSRFDDRNTGRSALLWPFVIPLISLIIACVAAFSYYHQQIHLNQEAVSFKEKAEKAALKGQYPEALSFLKKADDLRPSYKVLEEDQAKIKKATELANSLNGISDLLKTQQIEKADTQISSFKKLLQEQKGPLFTPFQKKIEEKETTLAIAKIKIEINNLNTVDELASKLTDLSSLQTAETEGVKQLILSKIIDVTTKGAEKQLSEKQFLDATSTIDKGLEYADKDKKLLSFKERIQNEQSAFEKAEQQRVEQAMEAAAQEDLKNHTSAVNVVELNATTDEYGDVHITGQIKNTATVPISSISLYYTIYDLNGNTIGSDYLYVTPYYLEPDGNASFDATYYGANQDTTVEITNATWQVN